MTVHPATELNDLLETTLQAQLDTFPEAATRLGLDGGACASRRSRLDAASADALAAYIERQGVGLDVMHVHRPRRCQQQYRQVYQAANRVDDLAGRVISPLPVVYENDLWPAARQRREYIAQCCNRHFRRVLAPGPRRRDLRWDGQGLHQFEAMGK